MERDLAAAFVKNRYRYAAATSNRERLDSGLFVNIEARQPSLTSEKDLAAAFVNINYRYAAATTNRERLGSDLHEYKSAAAFIYRERERDRLGSGLRECRSAKAFIYRKRKTWQRPS